MCNCNCSEEEEFSEQELRTTFKLWLIVMGGLLLTVALILITAQN